MQIKSPKKNMGKSTFFKTKNEKSIEIHGENDGY